ncbi:MAG: hypothetical protein ACLT69_09880 [Intestinibacter bartlettii]
MQQSYYKYDTRALMFKYGTPEHKFYDYLIKKENYSRLKGLPIGQVELTIRTVSKDIGITEKVARRLINQFIENGLIKLVNKNPKGSKKPSTYVLKTYEEKGTEKDMDGADERAQNNENITSLESDKGHRKDTVKGTEKGTSKIDNINRIKNNNIYTSKFDELWKLYPNKKGKSDAKKNVIKLLKKNIVTFEELKRCVERYSNEVIGKDRQYMKHGSTFFNGGYVDYLDENYTEQKKELKKVVDIEKDKKIKEQAAKDLAAIIRRS